MSIPIRIRKSQNDDDRHHLLQQRKQRKRRYVSSRSLLQPSTAVVCCFLIFIAIIHVIMNGNIVHSFTIVKTTTTTTTRPGRQPQPQQQHQRLVTLRKYSKRNDSNDDRSSSMTTRPTTTPTSVLSSILLSSLVMFATVFQPLTITTSTSTSFVPSVRMLTVQKSAAYASDDTLGIVTCLFEKCTLELGKCITDFNCLANVICINTCNGRDDEIGCQIGCGDLFDSPTIGEFNKCVISDQLCVSQKPDENLYPELRPDQILKKDFSSKFWNGRYYITAGQNKLFDIFPCQVHFFTETSPGTFYGKLNWRIVEPDGEFFTRNALQEFIQDPKEPTHFLNHDNEYLHYKDDWYIIDYEYDNNPEKLPPFAFVYYRGSNDAWDGYGGVVVYTRDAKLPEVLLPRLRKAAQAIGYDFDKDFVITDNSCPTEYSDDEKLLLRERFAGQVVYNTEDVIIQKATQFRGNAINSLKAQKIFFKNQAQDATKAFDTLQQNEKDFEQEQINKK